jgi:hypothetical protein
MALAWRSPGVYLLYLFYWYKRTILTLSRLLGQGDGSSLALARRLLALLVLLVQEYKY